MDTDKDPKAARVGEREARVASPYISKLAAGFNHGIGRSGQLTGAQPKAVGASIMQQVANHVALDAIKTLGLANVRHGIITPLSTGMTLALVFAALRRELGINQILYPRRGNAGQVCVHHHDSISSEFNTRLEKILDVPPFPLDPFRRGNIQLWSLGSGVEEFLFGIIRRMVINVNDHTIFAAKKLRQAFIYY